MADIPPVRRRKEGPHRPFDIIAADHWGRMHRAIGIMIQSWGAMDASISTAINQIERALEDCNLAVPDRGIPARFSDRLKKLTQLVRDHCTDERGLEMFANIPECMPAWTALRDDLSHGSADPYIDSNGNVRIYIIPSRGREMRPDLAYSIPIETIETDVGGLVAGFTGKMTGIFGKTRKCLIKKHYPNA